MLKWFVKKQLAAFQKRWNYDTGYMQEIVDEAGANAVFPMQGLQKLASFRGGLPPAVYAGAGLTASKHADCGPCLQLGVSMAEANGVPPDIIRAILQEDMQALPEDVRLGVEIARSTIARDGSGEEAREKVLRRFGRRGLVALGYAIVVAQSYPTFKYAIGHGHACVRVRVGNETVALREAAPA